MAVLAGGAAMRRLDAKAIRMRAILWTLFLLIALFQMEWWIVGLCGYFGGLSWYVYYFWRPPVKRLQ